jgi:hypothetical protein
LDPCQYQDYDEYYVVVNGQDVSRTIDYNIYYALHPLEAVELTNGEPMPGELNEYQYNHFKYEVEEVTNTTSLVAVVYLDEPQNLKASATLFVNFGDYAGNTPCFSYNASRQGSDKIVYIINPCDLREGTYYFSVYSTARLGNRAPFKYTITVTELDTVNPVESSHVFSSRLYTNQLVYYTLSTGSLSETDKLDTITVDFSNVQGTLHSYFSLGHPAENCPCFKYLFSMDVSFEQLLHFEYCQLQSNQTYFVTLRGGGGQSEVGYTMSVQSRSIDIKPLHFDTTTDESVRSSDFTPYKLDPATKKTSQILVNITNVSGGTISLFGNSGYPASLNCGTRVLCQKTGSCMAYLQPYDEIDHITVYGESSESSDPITYQISIHEIAPTSLEYNQIKYGETLPVNGAIYYEIPQKEDNSIVVLQLSQVNHPLNIYGKGNDICNTTLVFSGITNGNQSILTCQSAQYLAFFPTITTSTTSYNIQLSKIDLNPKELKNSESVQESLSPGDWHSYFFTVPAPVNDTRQKIVFKLSNANFGFTMYLNQDVIASGKNF